MDTGADVRSLQALQDWYAALVEFRTEGHTALTTVAMALQQASAWLDDQHDHWKRAIRTAEEDVSQAKIELRNRQFQGFTGERPDTTVQEKALRRAEAELERAEEQLRAVRRWMQKLPQAIQNIYLGPARNLEHFLDTPLIGALAQLDQHLTALERYVGVRSKPRPDPRAVKEAT